MTIVIALVGLGVLIFVHELGHFTASLALRMRPRKFYVGFPPALAKTTRGGIEYGIGMIPLGGFVKIPGMHRPAPVDVDHHLGRAVAEAPELAGPIDRFRRTLTAGDMDAARALLPGITELVSTRSLSDDARRTSEKGLVDLADALGPDAYWRAPTWRRVTAILAGPAANILLAIVLFTVLFMSAGGRATTTIDWVNPDSPAATAGLQAGDTILEIGGVPIEAEEISSRIAASQGEPLTLVVIRNGEPTTIGPVRPRESEDGRHRLGFALAGEGMGFGEAAGEALSQTALVTKEIVKSLGRLVTGDGRDEISSPVGIVQGSSEAAKQGAESYLWVLALISLSIALLNLLPLLPLDGGHIAFAIVEGIRGRSVGREIYERVSVVGIGVVLLLFFIGLSNDVGRLS